MSLNRRVTALERTAGATDGPTYAIVAQHDQHTNGPRLYLLRPPGYTLEEVPADTDLTDVQIASVLGRGMSLDDLHGGHCAPPRL